MHFVKILIKGIISLFRNIPIFRYFLLKTLRLFQNYLKTFYLASLLISKKSDFILFTFGKKLPNSSTNEQEKYLFYCEYCCAGLEHVTKNLKVFLQDSKQLDRIAVLHKPNLTPTHNNNIAVNSSWFDYYDIEKILQENGIKYILYKEFIKKQFAQNEVLFTLDKKITALQNQKYKLIVRDLRKFGFYKYLNLVPVNEVINFYPQKTIIEEAKKAQRKLPDNYCAIHIRRTDQLIKHKELVEVTSPQNILKKLKCYNPQKLPVFLMSDEPNKFFFNDLYDNFQIFRYWDFKDLVKIKKKNNYLIFMIEKEIFANATIKILTAKQKNQIETIKHLNKKPLYLTIL